MNETLATYEPKPLSAEEIKSQVQTIQKVMSAVMTKDVHYGTIPGCGNKPALFKPGAEKLMMTFRLAADPQIMEVPTEDGITFRVTCRILNQSTGIYLGSGVGECSTKEEKYNWRKAVCDGEYDDTPEDRRRGKWQKGYDNKPDYQIKQVRTNPADVANTVLKMAKKRALVDAILTVTAASDIFDQDLEEMPEDLRQGNGNGGETQKKSSTVKPAGNKASTTAKSHEGEFVVAKVDSVTTKKGIKNGKDWQAWTVLAGGEKYGTFSESFAAVAIEGTTVRIGFTIGKFGKEIVSIEPCDEVPVGADPEGCTKSSKTCAETQWGEAGDILCGLNGNKPCAYANA